MTKSIKHNITIRRFDPAKDSIEELTLLLNRAYKGLADMGLRYWATYQGPDVTAERIKNRHCFVAFLGGKLVGTITYAPPNQKDGSPWYDRPEVAGIGQFGVEPELQGQGIGLQMMQFIEEHARANGAEELALDTAEPALHLIRWYESLGYRLIETVQWKDTNYRSVIMSKRVGGGWETGLRLQLRTY